MTLVEEKTQEKTEAKSLSVSLRECTAGAHNEAENSQFMSRLLQGTLSREAAAALTGQLWFVYGELERAARKLSTRPRMAQIFDERLERTPSLEQDLTAFYGDNWQLTLAPSPATMDYILRLRELAESRDELGLIAHHYVRYLGDLAGGQVIATMLGRHYGIEKDALTFYNFDALGKIKPYREDYKARLDSLMLTEAELSHTLEEANRAFSFNARMFADLGANKQER